MKLFLLFVLTSISTGVYADSLPRPLPRKLIRTEWSTEKESVQAIVYNILVQTYEECEDNYNCPVQPLTTSSFKVGYTPSNQVQCNVGWVGRSLIQKFQCIIPEKLDATHFVNSSAAILYKGLAKFNSENPNGPVFPWEDADGYTINTEKYQLSCSKKYLNRSMIELYSCDFLSIKQ